jgi:hypothetical protein
MFIPFAHRPFAMLPVARSVRENRHLLTFSFDVTPCDALQLCENKRQKNDFEFILSAMPSSGAKTNDKKINLTLLIFPSRCPPVERKQTIKK